jgi:YHS domain-containing protein
VLLRSLLIFLVVMLVVRALWRLVAGIAQGMSGSAAAHRPASPPAMKMARDPVCGTYVVPGKALQLASGRETIYFCSENCRRQWSNAH